MDAFQRKMHARLRVHPEIWNSLLVKPTEESLDTISRFNLLELPNLHLAPFISPLLPRWEQEACDGNKALAILICYLEQRQTILEPDYEWLAADLQRIRILASTPGVFPFSPVYIQEHLLQYLESAESLADLPEMGVIDFAIEELAPLASDLNSHHLHPHSHRYVQNLFHAQRQEAILAVLAYIAKNHSLLRTCRQAYALMLSLDQPELWGEHPFCLRLLNRGTGVPFA